MLGFLGNCKALFYEQSNNVGLINAHTLFKSNEYNGDGSDFLSKRKLIKKMLGGGDNIYY